MTEPPCPKFTGKSSRSSSSKQPDEALPRELVSSLFNGAYADPQKIVWSHTFAEEEITQVTAGSPREETNGQTTENLAGTKSKG